jgi:hypothetical protein
MIFEAKMILPGEAESQVKAVSSDPDIQPTCPGWTAHAPAARARPGPTLDRG